MILVVLSHASDHHSCADELQQELLMRESSAERPDKPVPVLLITGFLGAGKTTYVMRTGSCQSCALLIAIHCVTATSTAGC